MLNEKTVDDEGNCGQNEEQRRAERRLGDGQDYESGEGGGATDPGDNAQAEYLPTDGVGGSIAD
jgi:hypothetical protein